MAHFTAAKANLQRLVLVRSVAIIGLSGGLLYAKSILLADLRYGPLLAAVLALVITNLATLWRLRRGWPVTEAEFIGQLLIDVAALATAFYFSGGANNPFISYLLVPLSIAATVLHWRAAVMLALLCVGLYTLLLYQHEPVPLFQLYDHHPHNDPLERTLGVNFHIAGMWFNFALSALLITSVVVRMAQALREQAAELTRQREQALQGEQLLAVATLAAGTAHELGTPLATMTLLLDEMESDDDQLQADLQLLRQQVESCRATLRGLVNTAEAHQRGQFPPQPADRVIQEALTRWQVMRPSARFELSRQAGEAPLLRSSDAVLQQAIINLLDNGMDAGGPLQLRLQWDDQFVELRIRDRGPGIPLEIAEQLGRAFVTSKGGKGLGLGLFLSNATAERCGGEVRLYGCEEGGSEAVLRLPVA